MCDCEELEFEDFELMLTAISKIARTQMEEVPSKATIPQLVAVRNRK